MIALLLRHGWQVATSRIGLALLVCAAALVWHVYDKRQAVSAARDGYVRQFELIAAQAELAALHRRIAAADRATEVLAEKVRQAMGDAQRFAAELEAFENETKINPDGIVDPGLLRRLRSN